MPPAIGQPIKVLFVCLGNACRSQMAEALARFAASDVMLVASAGTIALGEVPEMTRQVLEGRGVAMDGQHSKLLSPAQKEWADLIVNMTGQPAKIVFPDVQGKVEDWDIPDPFGQEPGAYEVACDEIETRVGDLARRLRQARAARKS